MSPTVLIAGGGIGGLAAALAASRAGCRSSLFEQAPAFAEAGAGIQLGPNVLKVLYGWGLADALNAVAAFPQRLQVRSALSGGLLGELRLGAAMLERYGAPYATVHRADLHQLLLEAVQQQPTAQLYLNNPVQSFRQTPEAVSVQTADRTDLKVDVLVGADGLWSGVRRQLLGDGLPQRTGHLAYRAMLQQSVLPERLRSRDVTVWLGPRMHIVCYPVRCGELLNVVVIVQGDTRPDLDSWDHSANAADLAAALRGSHAGLQDLIQAVNGWRLWPLGDRPPMQGAQQQAVGRVALLGDAAHPMLPYLAQGAGMAIEDAAELGQVLKLAHDSALDVPGLLQRYASNRWLRNARVQARARRNGQLFHADGPLRWARDASMKLLGEKLLDLPWLYGASSTSL